MPPRGLLCVLHWGEASVWILCHKAQIGGVLQWWLSFWKWNSSPHMISWAQPEWLLGYWSPVLPWPFSPWLLSFAGQPALGRFLVVPNFIHLGIMEAQCSWEPLMQHNCFCSLPQICASTQSCLWALQTVPLTSWLGLLLWYALSAERPYIDWCVTFQHQCFH